MKPEYSAIKEKLFCVLSVISLFTAEYKTYRKVIWFNAISTILDSYLMPNPIYIYIYIY